MHPSGSRTVCCSSRNYRTTEDNEHWINWDMMNWDMMADFSSNDGLFNERISRYNAKWRSVGFDE